MKKATTTILITSALAASLAAAVPVFARGPDMPDHCAGRAQSMAFGRHGDPEARIERMAQRLNLSTEQRDAMRAIVDKARPQMRALRDRLTDNRTQLRTLTLQGNADEARVRTLADAQGKAMADLIVLRTQMRSEMDKVLTEPQRQQLRQRFGQRGPDNS